MNNTTNSAFYAFLASAALLTGTAGAMNSSMVPIAMEQSVCGGQADYSSTINNIPPVDMKKSVYVEQATIKQRSPAQQLTNSTNAFKKKACKLLNKQSKDIMPLLKSMQKNLNKIIRITKEQSTNINSERINLLKSIRITNKKPRKDTVINWLNILEDVNTISFSQGKEEILQDSTIALHNLIFWQHNNLSYQLKYMQNISSDQNIQNYLLQILWWHACNQNDCIKNIEYIFDIEACLQNNKTSTPIISTSNEVPEFLPITIDDLDSIKTLPRHIQKFIIQDQLRQFVIQWKSESIPKNLVNLTKYLSLLIKYKDFVAEENNLNEIDDTIITVQDHINTLQTTSKYDATSDETDIAVDEDALTREFSANTPLGTNSSYTVTQTALPASIHPNNIDHCDSAKETINVCQDGSHNNSAKNIETFLAKTPISPSQYIVSTGTKEEEDTGASVGRLDVSTSSSSEDDNPENRILEFDDNPTAQQTKSNPNHIMNQVDTKVVFALDYLNNLDTEEKAVPEQKSQDSFNMWNYISNTITNSLSGIQNFMWNLFGWLKVW